MTAEDILREILETHTRYAANMFSMPTKRGPKAAKDWHESRLAFATAMVHAHDFLLEKEEQSTGSDS